jgi:hypothetical protein
MEDRRLAAYDDPVNGDSLASTEETIVSELLSLPRPDYQLESIGATVTAVDPDFTISVTVYGEYIARNIDLIVLHWPARVTPLDSWMIFEVTSPWILRLSQSALH